MSQAVGPFANLRRSAIARSSRPTGRALIFQNAVVVQRRRRDRLPFTSCSPDASRRS